MFCVPTFFGIALSFFIIFINVCEYIQILTYYGYNDFQTLSSTYDYIVVGSGTAGSIIAFRLSESGKHSVLLLEAGPYGNFLLNIPAIGPLLHKTNVDWKYHTQPQKYACGALKNKESRWPMGRIFGGTARLNNMIYLRGHENDYYEWYKEKHDYSYNIDILPYFKKSENQTGVNMNNTKHHSTDGPMYVDDLLFTSQLGDAVLKAANILGYPIHDLNAGHHFGFMQPQVNIKNGKRWTISDALLEKRMKNLHILMRSHVNKILFKEYNEVYGVNFQHFAKHKSVQATKGVILSAGVIGTPKLLMASGIGPQYHLSQMGIKIRKNLPVGENLQDHITTGLDLIILNESLSINVESLISPISAWEYFVSGKGPWTSVGCETIAIPQRIDFKKMPELQLMVLPFGITSDGGKHLRKAISVSDKVWNSYFAPLIGKQTISILPILLHPKSRGTVRLKNSDPNSQPIIDPNYLSNDQDIETLLKGIKLIGELLLTEPFKKLGAQLYMKPFPGCEDFIFDTKDYWICYIKQLTLTSFHPGGTCRMGHENDPTSVVDYNFRVIGINNLYIVDASVMPNLPSGNINAAVAMIAEKLADVLKKIDYLNNTKIKKMELFITKDICDMYS